MKNKYRVRKFIKSSNKIFSEKWGIQIKCGPSVNNAEADGFFWVPGWVFDTEKEAKEKIKEWNVGESYEAERVTER